MNDLIKEEIIKKHPYNVWQGKGKDKRWRTYIPDKTNKYGRKLIIKPDEESIYQWLNDFYKEELIADLLDKVNLEVFYYEWLKYKRLHTTASTYITRIESDWKTFYVGTPIVKIPLKNINKLTLDIWAHRLIKEHDMTRKKYVNVQVIMRQALSYAVDLDIIKSNPMESLKIDKRIFRKEQKKPDNTQVFTFDERKQIVALAWEDFKNSVKFYELSPLALAFQFQTGLRIGELCAVRFSDIENENYIHIQRMVRRDSKEIVAHTKTNCGDRYVFLSKNAKKIIATAQERQKELGGAAGGYIFSLTSEPIPERCITSLLKKYCGLLGILYRSSHKVRKTYGSSLLEGGVSINTTRIMLGHSDEKTTLKYYCFDTHTEAEKVNLLEDALKMS